ncbi:MAG: M12 family metallo-peptidase [Acidobacteriota bacterium]
MAQLSSGSPGASGPAAAGPELQVPVSKLPSAQAQASLDELFYDYTVFELDTSAIHQQVERHSALSIHLGNQIFDLDLQLNDLRDADYRAVLMDESGKEQLVDVPVVTYKGLVQGEKQSLVRLTVQPGFFTGYVQTEEAWVFIDPLSDYIDGASPTDVVVYRDDDVKPDASKTCGSGGLISHAPALLSAAVPTGGSATEAPRRIDVATEADGQYFASYGNPGIFTRAQGIINAVDGLYRSQLNLTLNITYQHGWSSIPGDPYTSLNASTSLSQLRSWWNSNRASINRDITHKFSGKNFSGSTIGIAYVGVVCNAPSFGYGISEDQSSSFIRTQLTAHEIGHNLSANHDNQAPVCSGVSCSGFGPIMCASIQSSGSNLFSSCSLSSIASHTATFPGCLN